MNFAKANERRAAKLSRGVLAAVLSGSLGLGVLLGAPAVARATCSTATNTGQSLCLTPDTQSANVGDSVTLHGSFSCCSPTLYFAVVSGPNLGTTFSCA